MRNQPRRMVTNLDIRASWHEWPQDPIGGVGDDQISGAPPPPSSTAFLAGIRPEDVRLAKSGDPFDHCLHARVTAVEQLGSQRIVHVAFGSPDSGTLDFSLRVTESRPLAVGDSIELTLAVDKITYFDRGSGLRL